MKWNFVIIAGLLLFAKPILAAESDDVDKAFKQGIGYMEKSEFDKALPYLEKVYESHPDSPGLLWNLGIASAELNRHKAALNYWEAFRKLQPDNWKATTKIIQAYQGLGDKQNLNKERADLLALRLSQQVKELSEAKYYCREQFMLNGWKVLAFEYFELQKSIYRFTLADKAGWEKFAIVFGTSDLDTQVAQKTGEIKEGETAYSWDLYNQESGVQNLLGFYDSKNLPEYEDVRSKTIKFIENDPTLSSGPLKGK
ncbi:MAG: hypothetical protein EXS63_08635 [Candidatus Omnitrophica bacterium]|nr:hypothetical protein [Candidatus Omnitrophota bacterium]